MGKIDLSHMIGLPPASAVEYLTEKGHTFSWDWHETMQEANAKAFTVAKAMRMDVLSDIREMVQKAFAEGITLEQFKKELTPRLQAKGWWGKQTVGTEDAQSPQTVQLGSPYRLKTIYRTNMQTAYMAGRWKGMKDAAEDRPHWEYVAVMDKRTRPGHASLNGKVFSHDDPFWDGFYPPNGWGCRCRVRALSDGKLTARGLSVSSSDGRLSEKDALVSKATGEMRPVAVYKDALTGKTVSPDVGWSYNPGKAAWQPDLDAYPYDVARKYVEGAVTGPAFTRFFSGKDQGIFPVAVLRPDDKALLGSESQVVKLSSETVKDHIEKHPEITVEDYRKLPQIIDEGEVYRQGEDRLIYLQTEGFLYRTTVKRTNNGKESYATTLFKTTDKKADRGVRKKYERIR